MTAEPVTAQVAPRGRWRRAVRILGVLLTGIAVTLAILVAFPPAGLIKDRLARIAGTQIGRTVTIGDARLAFRPDIHVRLDKVTVSNPKGMTGPDLLSAEAIEATIPLWPLVRGRGEVATLALLKPEIRLQEDGQGLKNWLFPSKGGRKPSLPLPRTANVEKGRVSFTSAKTGTTANVEDITGTVAAEAGGALKSRGKLGLKGDSVAYDLTLSNIQTAADGKATDVKAAFEGRYAKVALTGQALIASSSSGTSAIAGDLNASSGSALDLARWLGANVTPSGEPLKTTMSGKVKLTPSDIIFAGTDITVNTTTGRLDGRLGLSGPRPKLEGAITTERIDIARITGTARRLSAAPEALAAADGDVEIEIMPAWQQLLDDIEVLEGSGTASAAAQAPAHEARPKSAWSEQPLNLGPLKVLDLDVTINAREIVYGALDLKNGRIKAGVIDGRLDAMLETLDVGKGKARGSLALDSRADPPQALVAFNLTDVAAEPIITELTGKPLLSGTSNVDITAKAAGQNQSQLASTLEGKAKFRMGQGVLRGYDIRRMITEWLRGWKFDLGMKTRFEHLEAQYDIKKGVMRSSPDFELGGSEVEISSRGDVNVPAKRLNQEIRVKIVPPPTALPIPVRISGDWKKPSVGIDFLGLLSSLGGLGGPQGIAPPSEPPPPEVQAAIKRVLASDIPPEKLSEDGKAMLRSLLPPEASR